MYGPFEVLKMHHLVDCILRNVLQRETIAAAVDTVWHKARAAIRIWNVEAAPAAPDSNGADEAPESSPARASPKGHDSARGGKKAKRGHARLSRAARKAAARSSAAAQWKSLTNKPLP